MHLRPHRSPAFVGFLAIVGAAALSGPALSQNGPNNTLQVAVDRPLPPPALFIASDGPAKQLGVTRVSVEARIIGHLAHTEMTLTFGNTHSRALAGDLYFPLPADATVSGYALDVGGQLVDGVVVPKDEARRIFEAEVRKGVDPGLVEWTRGNVFKTRVFPIPPNGTRTVRLSWVAPLESEGGQGVYELPLSFENKVSEAKIRVEVVQADAKPVLEGGEPLQLAFNTRQVAETTLKDRPVVANLRIKVPAQATHGARFERSGDEGHSAGTWFSLRDQEPAPKDLPRLTPKRVQVFWDTSRSRDKAAHEKELSLLTTWLRQSGASELEFTSFSNAADKPVRFAIPAEIAKLESHIKALTYDGGTQLGSLGLQPGPQWADAVIVFTDGISTFGVEDPGSLGAPTWLVSSGSVRATPAMAALAAKNGGAFIDLARVTEAEALTSLGRPTWSLVGVEVLDGTIDDLRPGGVEPAAGPTHIYGRLRSASATLRLSWGVPGKKAAATRTHKLVPPSEVPIGETLRFAWAQKQLSVLMASPDRNAAAIVALGRAHTLVTPGTSLLVLETLEQYLTWNVEPPRTWKEMHASFVKGRSEKLAVAARLETDQLDAVAKSWAEEIAWYKKDFVYKPKPKEIAKSEELEAGGMGVMGSGSGGGGTARSAPSVERSAVMMDRAEDQESDARPDAMMAKGEAKKDGGNDGASEPAVSIKPWDPDVPWTRALKAAQPADRVKVYFSERTTHGAAPSFYLDCADYFLSVKDRRTALRVLSNLAEMRLDEPALMRVLAHRLAQEDELQLAALVFEQVLRLRPEEPQSYRDLALVLGRRALEQGSGAADLGRALDLLATVVKRKWDRFDGIEIIALYEFNRFVEKGGKLGVKNVPLDKRFIYATPLDIRLAMSWDADLTDMDLHVLEPSGEEAYYSNNLTELGGRVSRDFTQGYGPETYSIKRAMKGPYAIKTKYFSSGAVQLTGAVTLQVDVYTNWGRPNEKRQSLTLRLTESKEEFVVGEIVF